MRQGGNTVVCTDIPTRNVISNFNSYAKDELPDQLSVTAHSFTILFLKNSNLRRIIFYFKYSFKEYLETMEIVHNFKDVPILVLKIVNIFFK